MVEEEELKIEAPEEERRFFVPVDKVEVDAEAYPDRPNAWRSFLPHSLLK